MATTANNEDNEMMEADVQINEAPEPDWDMGHGLVSRIRKG